MIYFVIKLNTCSMKHLKYITLCSTSKHCFIMYKTNRTVRVCKCWHCFHIFVLDPPGEDHLSIAKIATCRASSIAVTVFAWGLQDHNEGECCTVTRGERARGVPRPLPNTTNSLPFYLNYHLFLRSHNREDRANAITRNKPKQPQSGTRRLQ